MNKKAANEKRERHSTHICDQMRAAIGQLEAKGHEYVTSWLDTSEIHFAPSLQLRLTDRLTKDDMALIEDDCAGQMKYDLKQQWFGCWCATVRFNGKKK